MKSTIISTIVLCMFLAFKSNSNAINENQMRKTNNKNIENSSK
jgi:hypothetical protein